MIDSDALAKHTTNSNVAMSLMNGALAEYNTYLQCFNWDEAEKARLRAVSHMEVYLDGLRAVYQMLEKA